MTRAEALILIEKYIQNLASPAERNLVEQHLHAYLNREVEMPDHLTIAHAHSEIWNHLEKHIAIKKNSLWGFGSIYRLAVAGCLIFAIGAGSIMAWSYYQKNSDRVLIVNALDVLPGKNRAILSSNGKSIVLNEQKQGLVIDETKLRYSDNSAIESDMGSIDLNETMTLTTPRGGTYKVTLKDGTDVWLNSGSTLKFPAQFNSSTRSVELIGEAYFEVKRQPKPFIVLTDRQNVEVLGTHFNINSYADESFSKTTLLEGSVRVSANVENMNQADVILKPEQQATLSAVGGIQVKKVDVEEVIAWKEGYFDFNEEKLESIMNKIARWYDVHIVYEVPKLKAQTFTGNISMSKNVSEVLKKLALSKVLRFKIDGRKIIVTE